jgi:hypothetical protein
MAQTRRRDSALAPVSRTPDGRVRRRSRPGALVAAAAVVLGLAVIAPTPAAAVRAHGQPDLGPNVLVFDPSMPTSQIQAAVDAVASKQVGNQFGTDRYALLFKPGTYGSAAAPLVFQVGYYTEVAGLGQSPTDVTINGHVDVYNQCDATGFCVALNNFWRSMSNLTINVMGSSDCHATANFWAASQAAPLRRVNVIGGTLSFMDYCSNPSFASGGFLADSQAGSVVNGSQQQFFVRDSSIGSWSNGVWNQVFAGVQGAPAQCFPAVANVCGPYTTLTANPVSREKPYLYVDSAGRWKVFVPAPRRNSAGTTWGSGPTPGRSVPLSDFYLAKPSDSVRTINKALARGQNLIFTPGVYPVERSIEIRRPDTVVLGLGIATLTAIHGATPIRVADVKGVDVASLMIDAGAQNSRVLLQVGGKHHGREHGRRHHRASDARDPIGIQDVFFRIGGPHLGKAQVSLEVNADNVVLDDIWAWRADHGTGVGWTSNTADTGVVVNGDHVTATGLFVEHFQKTEVVWNGEHGRTIFFQNEMPYDVPDQAAWMNHGVNGYPAYQVARQVKTHEAWGLGSYSFFNVGPDIHADHAFEVPVTPGVRMHDLLTVFLDPTNGHGSIDHVINDTGGSSSAANPDVPVTVVDYP